LEDDYFAGPEDGQLYAVSDGADELISLSPAPALALVLVRPPPYAVLVVAARLGGGRGGGGCKSGGVEREERMCRRQPVWGGGGAVRGAAMAGLVSISAGRH
jgi:hypothetical protein